MHTAVGTAHSISASSTHQHGANSVLQAQDTTPEWESDSMQQASALQRRVFQSRASPWGANAHTLVSVTGAVLYAQGLWGLW